MVLEVKIILKFLISCSIKQKINNHLNSKYVIGTASVARGYSEYLDSLVNQTIQRHMMASMPINVDWLSAYPDLLALAITLALTVMLSLGLILYYP